MKLFQDDLGEMLKLYTASFVSRGPKGYDIAGRALGVCGQRGTSRRGYVPSADDRERRLLENKRSCAPLERAKKPSN